MNKETETTLFRGDFQKRGVFHWGFLPRMGEGTYSTFLAGEGAPFSKIRHGFVYLQKRDPIHDFTMATRKCKLIAYTRISTKKQNAMNQKDKVLTAAKALHTILKARRVNCDISCMEVEGSGYHDNKEIFREFDHYFEKNKGTSTLTLFFYDWSRLTRNPEKFDEMVDKYFRPNHVTLICTDPHFQTRHTYLRTVFGQIVDFPDPVTVYRPHLDPSKETHNKVRKYIAAVRQESYIRKEAAIQYRDPAAPQDVYDSDTE